MIYFRDSRVKLLQRTIFSGPISVCCKVRVILKNSKVCWWGVGFRRKAQNVITIVINQTSVRCHHAVCFLYKIKTHSLKPSKSMSEINVLNWALPLIISTWTHRGQARFSIHFNVTINTERGRTLTPIKNYQLASNSNSIYQPWIDKGEI